jgi:CRP/FNR family transcriptional regulator, cyclic AMP receptor protein
MATSALRDEFRIPKNSVIFRQGDPGHEMFVISEGRVRLTIGTEGHEKEVGRLGPGEFFGELSLLSDAPRSATAATLEDTALLAIGRDVFAMMVQDDLDIVFRMMNIQGQRLSMANQPIQELAQRLGRVRVAAHGLRHVLAASAPLPASVDIGGFAGALGLTAQAVDATIADLVQRGVGSLQDHRWTIQNREQVDKLLEALCSYTAN